MLVHLDACWHCCDGLHHLLKWCCAMFPLTYETPSGDPGAIRTHDLQIRNLLLYPAELRDHSMFARRCGLTDEPTRLSDHPQTIFGPLDFAFYQSRWVVSSVQLAIPDRCDEPLKDRRKLHGSSTVSAHSF